MGLSSDLISQFAKATNDHIKREKETVITYGTAVKRSDIIYVKIDGSDLLTPVASTVNIRDGDRVTVMIKNHNATVTGNITSPSAGTEDIADAGKTATDFMDVSDSMGLIVGDKTDNILRGNIQIKAESGGASIALRDGTTILSKFSTVHRTFSGITSATISTGSSALITEDEDGTETTEEVTDVEQTISSSQSRTVVKMDSVNPIYFPKGIVTDKILLNDDNFILNVNTTLNGNIFDKNGKAILEPVTSNGNLAIGYGRYKAASSTSTDFSTLYGNKVRLYTKNGAQIIQDGRVALETSNSQGNMVIGYHLKKKGSGNLNLYAGDNVSIYANGTIIANSAIVPASNAALSLGKHNELGWSNIYIGGTSGSYNGLSIIVDGTSLNLCGRDASNHFIFGNSGSVMHYVNKSVDTSTTGTAFKFTSGDNEAANNTESVWLFGAADTTSRYIGSFLAYNRTYSSAANMCVTENGVFGRSTSSSQRYKRDIVLADIHDLKALYDLPVKKFKYKNNYLSSDDELFDKYLYGFIVEDLENILPCAVQHKNDDGSMLPEMWNSNIIIPSLLKLIQDLNNRLKVIEEGV